MTPTDIVKQIQEALEFYGNKESYIFYPLREDGNSQTDIIGSPVDKDDGKIARKKLNLIPDLLTHLGKRVSLMECAVAAANVTRKRYGLSDISTLSKDIDYRIFDETKAVLDRAGVLYHD